MQTPTLVWNWKCWLEGYQLVHLVSPNGLAPELFLEMDYHLLFHWDVIIYQNNLNLVCILLNSYYYWISNIICFYLISNNTFVFNLLGLVRGFSTNRNDDIDNVKKEFFEWLNKYEMNENWNYINKWWDAIIPLALKQY